jgi:hypothetical protein
MLPDPKMSWKDGRFPYDALAAVGVHPDSDMQQVKDAFYELIERGERSQESRVAWNALRNVQERLWVDLFLHSLSADQIAKILEQNAAALDLPTDSAADKSPAVARDALPAALACPLDGFDDQIPQVFAEIEFET